MVIVLLSPNRSTILDSSDIDSSSYDDDMSEEDFEEDEEYSARTITPRVSESHG